MVAAILMSWAMLGQARTPAPGAPADLEVYQAARSKVGHDARAHIRLALWCEAHGLSSERLEQLALAVVREPHNATARGLLGLVSYRGKWQPAADVAAQVHNDPAYQDLVREYLDRRARTPERVDDQLKLATWCREKGLEEQARAHYGAVVRLDPSREIAWKRLGYKRYGHRWMKPEDAAAARREDGYQHIANRHWKARLVELQNGLMSSNPRRREQAAHGLTEITDPRAVPMVWRVFATGGEGPQLAAVQVLGQIDGAPASNAIAVLAVFSPSPRVRERATASLSARDPRDVVGNLIKLVRRPFKISVRPGSGPGSIGELDIDGERFDLRRLYEFPALDVRLVPDEASPVDLLRTLQAVNGTVASRPGGPDAVIDGITRTVTDEERKAVDAAEKETLRRDLEVLRTMTQDIQTVEAANNAINQLNGRVLPILETLTGKNLGAEPETWQTWWTDQLGYVYQSSRPATKPTYTETVYVPNVQLPLPVPGQRHHSCFAAGTLIHTIDGPRPIESIRVGDRVLSQDTTTGQLAFEPVVATHLNDPSPTLRIRIDGESIVATGIHRFWKAGKGWVMARELKPGDRLRRIGGIVAVASVEADKTQPVYNLDVADCRDYFVGDKGLLVHDFSFVRPVHEPFDRLTEPTETTVPYRAR